LKLKNESSSLKFYLQKLGLREKEEQLISKVDLQVKVQCQVNEQNQGSKVDLQTIDLNVKVELVKKTSTLDIQIEIVDQIDNQKFKKYLDYHWIQKSIVRNAASRTFKRARD
jgi:hypothetical protein